MHQSYSKPKVGRFFETQCIGQINPAVAVAQLASNF